jgi:hypothetical protein
MSSCASVCFVESIVAIELSVRHAGERRARASLRKNRRPEGRRYATDANITRDCERGGALITR